MLVVPVMTSAIVALFNGYDNKMNNDGDINVNHAYIGVGFELFPPGKKYGKNIWAREVSFNAAQHFHGQIPSFYLSASR